MSAWLTSFSHPLPQWSPEDSPRLSQPFWPAYLVSPCPSLSFHSPSRPECRRWLMLPQSHKKFLTASCTHQRTSVSSTDGDGFGPSCTGHLCCVSRLTYCGLFGEVVDYRSFQLPPEEWWLDCAESTGEVKKHDSHSKLKHLANMLLWIPLDFLWDPPCFACDWLALLVSFSMVDSSCSLTQ